MKMVRKINILKGATVVILLCFSLLTNTLWAQDLIWKSNFTGSGHNYPGKSAIDSQNNIYVIGIFNGTCNGIIPILTTRGGYDAFIAKYDSNGNLIWIRQIGGSLTDGAYGIVISPDDQYIYVVGSFQGTASADYLPSITSSGSDDGYLAKYRSDGNIVWLKCIASGSSATVQRPSEIKIDKNNNLVIGGSFITEIKLGSDLNNISFTTAQPIGMFISQFDTSGTIINAKKFEASGSPSQLYSFDFDNSGYYLAGYYAGNLITDLGIKASRNNSADMFVYKVDYNLSGQWIVTAGGNGTEYLTSSSVDNQGNFYFGGYFTSTSLTVDSTSTGIVSKRNAFNTTSDGKSDIFFAKYSSSGVLQWFNTAGSTENDYLYRALYKNGDFIVAGQYGANLTFNNQTITSKGNGDAFAIVHDNNDNLKYLIPIGGSGADIGETAVVDNNGNFVVIGDYTSPKIYLGNKPDSLINSYSGTKDMFVAKYDKGSLHKVVTPILCAGTSTGTINITPMGTVVEPYTYAWSKRGDGTFSSNNEDLNGISAGTYKVTFTDALGYTKIDSVTLTDPAPLTVALTSQTNPTCFNGTNGKIDITPAGGTLPYAYVWNTTNGTGMDATSQDQNAVSAGTYSVVVNDFNGCTIGINNVAIGQPQKITFAGSSVTDIITSPSFVAGSIDLNVSGGSNVYSYLWSGHTKASSKQDTAGIVNPGTYSVTVTDSKNCLADTALLVNDGTLLVAYIQAQQNVSCHGGSNGIATVGVSNASGTLSYLWDDASATTTAVVSGLAAGTYHVTVTDDRGGGNIVTSAATTVITEPLTLQLSAINKLEISCYDKPDDGILDAVINGGTVPYSYHWTKDGVDYATNEDLTSIGQGNYALTVTDANGCMVSGSNTITRPLPITISGTVDSVTCEGSRNDGAITLSNPTGGWPAYTYLWSNGLTTQNINLLNTGLYTVTVTDSRNCKTTLTKNVDYEAPMSVTFNVNDVLCKGASTGNANALVTGGHTPLSYQWSNSTTNSGVTGVIAGSYTVTVTDNRLCTKSRSVTINEPLTALDVTEGTSGDVTCNGGSNGYINIAGTGGTPAYNYLWSNGTSGTQVSGLTAGDYDVTVVDNHSCQVTKTYNVAQPPALVLTEKLTSHVDLLCNGASAGVIEVQASGGTGAFNYAINGGSWVSNPLFSGLTGNSYSLSVQDAASCTYTIPQNITIVEPSAISLGTPDKTDVTCHGLENGSISVSATGGTGSLSYLLKLNGTLTGNTSGASTGSFTNLIPSTGYTIEVTDANSCGPMVSNSTTIAQPSALLLTEKLTSHVDLLCNGASAGVIEVQASGGTGAFNYAINGGSWVSNPVFSGLTGNSYSLSVQDAASCTYTIPQSITIIEPSAILLGTPDKTDVTCHGLENGSISLSATGGTGSLSYLLKLNGTLTGNTSGASTGSFTNLIPSTGYTIEVTDANSCGPIVSSSTNITEPQAITLGSLNSTNISCFGSNDGIISTSASGGASPLAYTLAINGIASSNTSGLSSGNFTNVTPGNNYTIEVNDANNCGPVVSSTLDILEPSAISILKDSVKNATSGNPWNGSRLVVAAGGTGPLTYSLNSQIQDTGVFTGLPPGNYVVTVVDQNNCPVNSNALTVSDATDIPGLKQDNLRIYPNPIHDEVTLDFGYTLTDALLIEVIAVNGQTYYKDNITGTSGKIKLNLGSLPRGLYLLKINNEVLRDKLILQ